MSTTPLAEVLVQRTATEYIGDPANETFITLKLRGGGAVKRSISEGKTPRPFRGYRVHANDFIYSRIDARNGAFALLPEELDGAVVSKDFPSFAINLASADPAYLRWITTAPEFAARIQQLSFGATNRQRVDESSFLRLTIPLPPLPEQRRIAAILDEADALRRTRLRTLELFDAELESEYRSQFPGDGSIPVAPLGDLVKVQTGSTPSRQNAAHFGGGIPWVKTTEVQFAPITQTSETVSELGVANARLRLYPEDSIVVAMYGQGRTRGQSARLAVSATVNQACAVIPPNDVFLPAFLEIQLRLSYDSLRSMARGGNQANLNLDLVRSLSVIAPPVSQQARFDRFMVEQRVTRRAAESSLSEFDTLFASLQHRAFRGQL